MGRFAEKLFIEPDHWRPGLLQLMLQIILAFGLVVFVPSIFISVSTGLYGVVIIDTLAICVIGALLHFKDIEFRIRALCFLAVCYMLGVGLLVNVGSISQIYLFGFSIIATLLLGLRLGLVASAISSITLLVVGWIGIAAPEMLRSDWGHSLASWLVITLNFALISAVMTLAIGAIIGAFEVALGRAVLSRAALDEERTVLRTLLDTLPDVVFTKDTNGRFQLYNPAMLDLVGLSQEASVVGKTVYDLYPRNMAEIFTEDDQRVLAGASVFNKEEQSLKNSGEPQWYLTRKVPLRNQEDKIVGLIGVSRDITDRKRFEAELSRLIIQLQVQIERLPLGYLLTDHNFRFTRWNPAAERMFGFPESEVVGKHPFDLIVPEDQRAEVSRSFEKIRSGEMESHTVLTNVTKDGREITCEWHNTPLFDREGSFTGLLSIANDISERRILEEHFQQAQKIDAIGNLAGGIAHDFNNLLTIINGYADIMMRTMSATDPNRKRLEEISKAGQRSATLTSQLLSFSRRQVLEPKILDLNDVVRDAESMLGRIIGEDIDLSLSLAADLSMVKADPGRLEQVLMNMVVNSRDSMPLGGKLTIETRNIDLDESYARFHANVEPGRYVQVTITDTGHGMSDEVRRQVFEPYFTTKTKAKGTGLGLSVAYGIIKQSGGNVEVYSESGVGTVFKIYLPVAENSQPVGNALASAEPAPQGDESIMVVEDEPGVRGLICATLTDLGYSVTEAGSGEEALAIFGEMSLKPDIVITDVVMPGMGGRLLSEKLNEADPNLPILFMSGYTDDAVVRHGILHESVNFIQKPFAPATLGQKIREILEKVQLDQIPASPKPVEKAS